MRKIIVALIAVALFALTACGGLAVGGGIDSGTVYDKDYHSAKTYKKKVKDYTKKCKTVKKKTKCSKIYKGHHYKTTHKKATYVIKFKNKDGQTGSDHVSRRTYNRVQVGQFYEDD